MVEISRLVALAVGKAYYVRLYSYSRFKKREPPTDLLPTMWWGGGGINFCVRSSPLRKRVRGDVTDASQAIKFSVSTIPQTK